MTIKMFLKNYNDNQHAHDITYIDRSIKSINFSDDLN